MNTLRRWLLCSGLVLSALSLVGCSTTANVTDLKTADGPLVTTGLRILYLEREVRVNSSHPYFKDAKLAETIADLGTAVFERLPAGLNDVGIETATLAVPTDVEGHFPPEAQAWLKNTHADWPVLLVVPVGGYLFCNPCSFKTDAVLELRDVTRPGDAHWAARLKQPELTGSLSIGVHAMHVHFANEMLRALLVNVRGPKSP